MASIKLSPSRKKAGAAITPSPVKNSTNGNKSVGGDFLVKDISLAEWGRKTIQVSEHEMPGLMAIRPSTAGKSP